MSTILEDLIECLPEKDREEEMKTLPPEAKKFLEKIQERFDTMTSDIGRLEDAVRELERGGSNP